MPISPWPKQDIARIESMLTVAGGKIVYAAGEYEGLAAPLPALAPESSPVARFGGFQSTACAKAHAVFDAAQDSGLQRGWRQRRAELGPSGDVPDLTAIDPLTGCF
jgi:hypothetical protein